MNPTIFWISSTLLIDYAGVDGNGWFYLTLKIALFLIDSLKWYNIYKTHPPSPAKH